MPFIPTTRGFKMASLNTTSSLKHLDELKVFLTNNPIDVLAINETRLDFSITDCEVFIPGYEIFRRDRNINGRHGGGVCFYVQNNVNCIPRHDLNVRELENLCIKIHKPRSKLFLVASWYRSLDSSVDKFDLFKGLVGSMDAEGLEYYILGDMNVTNAFCSMIDLIYTNCSTRVACSGVCHIDISDHSLIYVYRKLAVAYPIVVIQL